ncbi:response regulator [Halosquirtibacter xylanolyticus]|uniref:hybrid sensor histidine kinase/response regulator transcription factor n=1 Tax=Halosquirtibacter xylanolyticus TaxID=3374599 RepID=UPI003747822D|nr:response regulator [Prolixibacteraceae bacterium]
MIQLFLYQMHGYASPQFQSIDIDIIRSYGTIPRGIIQGPKGYTWIFSANKLLRYDGTKIVDFTPQLSQFTQESNIVSIQKKNEGDLILVTNKGSFYKLYDNIIEPIFPKVEVELKESRVTIFRIISNKMWFGLSNGQVISFHMETHHIGYHSVQKKLGYLIDLHMTDKGTAWGVTNKRKLVCMSINKDQFEQSKLLIKHHPGWIKITTGSLDDDLWIGTETEGLFHYNNGRLTRYNKTRRNRQYRIDSNIIFSLLKDDRGHIWIGTDGAGLIELSSKGSILSRSMHQAYNERSLGSNAIVALSQVTPSVMWVITNFGKVRTYTPPLQGMKYLYGRRQSTPTRVLSIFIDKKQRVWFGSDGYGLYCNDKGKVRQINTRTNKINGNYVQSIHEDNDGNIWYGTYQSGIGYLDKEGKNHNIALVNNSGITIKDIRCIFKDHLGNIWIGSNLGIHCIDPEKNIIASYSLKEIQHDYNPVFFIEETREAHLIIGSYKHLIVLENPRDPEKLIVHHLKGPKKEAINLVDGIKLKNFSFYFATANQGVIHWRGNLRNAIKSTEACPEKDILSLEAEGQSALWFSTKQGVVRHDLKEKTNIRWDEQHAEVLSHYTSHCSNTANGIIYLGGQEGVTAIDPQKLNPKNDPNQSFPILVNQVMIGNKEANQQIPTQVTKGYNSVESLLIPHDMNALRIAFSSNNTLRYFDENYRYKLIPFDKEWINNPSHNEINYTNIPAGKYRLIIEKHQEGQSIEKKTILITILRPVWFRWWAILIYVVTIGAIIFGFIHFITKWRLLNEKLELASWKHNEKEKFFSMKMDFFSKMSHEIQTPLTLIMLPIDEMITQLDNHPLIQKQLKGIKNNAGRLSTIAKNMLSTKERQSEFESLNKEHHNLEKHLQDTLEAFTDQAKHKHIQLNMDFLAQDNIFEYDKEKMEHVWYNILSNAFKFTPEYGNIHIEVTYNAKKQMVQITIKDSGCGVPSEEQERIFDMFYQSQQGIKKGGTGIGLALCKDLMHLHQGSIQLSPSHAGATFILRFPQNKMRSSLNQFKHTPLPNMGLTIDEKRHNNDHHKKSILIVEDHPEMRQYLSNYLSDSYHIETATNGQEALSKIQTQLFHMIVSDLQMEGMTGTELFTILKQNPKTQDIPFILITANHSKKERLDALKLGVDDYIQKPFEAEELKLRIKNYIFKKKNTVSSSHEFIFKHHVNSFTHKLELIINKEMSKGQISMEEIAQKLNMSYSSLYKKTNAETGISPNELLTRKRMVKAQHLLVYTDKSISQITFECGYSDPKYFSKAFRKQHQVSPKMYRENNLKN